MEARREKDLGRGELNMTYLQRHYKTVIIALAIAAIFALIDQYIMNASSYLCGALLAGVLIEKKKPARQEKQTEAGGEPMKCVSPCNGKLKHIATKKPGGV